MGAYLRNPEIKSIIIKLLFIHVIFSAIFILFIGSEVSNINKKIVDQNTAIIGQILYKYPELEADIIKTVTNTPTREEISKGREVLESYGYNKNISVETQPMLREIVPNFKTKLLLLALAYLIPLMLLIFLEYRKIFSKVKALSIASEAVVEGNFNVIHNEDEEGDFAILSYNFNNMANRLKLSLVNLSEDKIFLKNIISDISHQLKTPLTSLSAINDLLLEDKTIQPEIQKDFLEKSRSQLNRMEWLIINLLKMARLESGAINFKMKKFLVSDSIERALDPLILKAEEKHIKILIHQCKEEVYLYGDEEWIAEALSNIIKNSIEHTNQGGEIHIEASETTLLSSITIRDDGEGIDRVELPHIFERFYKGINTVKTESVGIGLALSKLIIEGQNGYISVISEKAIGTRFSITFIKGVL
ncbi:MAG TPA: HAMP domain-containing sensor histidine kinase [Clostridiaceae bacterium]